MTVPAEVLSRWGALYGRPAAPLGGGLINDTFVVRGRDARFVLQRLHPLWTAAVCEDVRVVTEHLARHGLITPRLLPCDDGDLCACDEAGRIWRVLTFVEHTVTHQRLDDAALAFQAGLLVGRVHTALDDLRHEYRFSRGNVHDTAKHLETLRSALDECRDHRLYDRVARVAEELFTAAAALPSFGGLPRRHVHGDLKISNLLFDASGQGVCVVDFDTLAQMIWPFEMGDALRSWCNPAGEDHSPVTFDLGLFESAVRGYATSAGQLISIDEQRLLPAGVMTISLELAARFLADALYERYFGFDPTRYENRGEHNLARGVGQWSLHHSVRAQLSSADDVVRQAFP